jgi:hypothetical protein
MKQGNIFLFLLFFGISFSANSQGGATNEAKKHALGIRISSEDAVINHSITYKYFFDPSTAVEGLFSFGDPLALGFLVEKHKPFKTAGLTWFWGVGAYAGFAGERNFGAQGVVGLDFIAPTLPVNFSIDWKPELNFIKEFSFEPAAVGFSARFIF